MPNAFFFVPPFSGCLKLHECPLFRYHSPLSHQPQKDNIMAHIFWTADLDTGFQDIDEQHKQLVFYINQLHTAYENNDPQQMNITLFDLISCTMNHFSYEEEMLAESGYHLIDAHKRIHQNFVNKLLEYQTLMLENPNVVGELLSMLDGWLFRHIRINDHGYIDMVLNTGIYQQNENGQYVRVSETERTPFNQVEFHDWETQSLDETSQLVDVTTEPTPPPQTAWERLVAQHEKNLAEKQNATKNQDDDDPTPRGWAGSF